MSGKTAARLRRIVSPRSLRYQLLIRSLLILALLLLAIGLLQYWFMRNFIYTSQAEAMKIQLNSVPRDLFGLESDRPEPDWPFPEITLPRSNPEAPSGSAVVEPPATDTAKREGRPYFFLSDSSLAYIDPEGNATNLTEESGLPIPRISTEQYVELLSEKHKISKTEYMVVEGTQGEGTQIVVFRSISSGPGHEAGMLQMSTPTAPLDNTLIRQLLIFVSLSALALCAGFAVFLPVMRKTLVPLNRIVNAVQRTNAGNLNERLPVRQGQEEIDRLSESFNGMLERLDASFQAEREAKEQMRRFINDASHELRTPLTSIHGFLEVLLRGAMDKPEQLRSALKSMYGESKRINKLVEDLLLLAKLDRTPQLTFKDTLLNEVIVEMEPQLRILAGNRSVNIVTLGNVKGKYDSDKIKQVILNLFHNAVQHTDPAEGKISLKLGRHEDFAELVIRDNGSGISPEHLPHVFDRFYRSESSRTRISGGAGLGLSITKSIVETHGGTIEVTSDQGVGTTFTIRLPLGPLKY